MIFGVIFLYSLGVRKSIPIFILILISLFIRIILIPHPGFEADMAYWKGWGLAVVDKGILWLVSSTNYNYPPAFAYILYVVNKIYAAITSPYSMSYWTNTNLLYLFLIKIITIAADFANALLIYKIAKKLSSPLGVFLALFYLLTPASFFDGAFWGQVDQLGLLFFLLSTYLLLIERLEIATIIFTLSFLIKFQNLMFIPIYFLYIFRLKGIPGLARNCAYSLFTFLVVSTPFWLNNQMEFLLRLMVVNADWFPHFSLNAFNIWWILSGLKGMQVTDRNLMIGITNAKSLGMLFFVGAYAIASLMIFFSKRESLFKRYLIASTLIVFAFFHLLTESHERYQFHILGLLPLLIIFDNVKHRKRNFVLLFLVSLFLFFNLYVSFYFNYPKTIYWPFSSELAVTASLIISIFQVGLFIVFFAWFIFKYIRQYLLFVMLIVGLLVVVFIGQNANYLLRRPIALSSLIPLSAAQDYLSPVTNMTVDSSQGARRWNRLSNNYYFYEKGIGSHADSNIYYHLNGKFSTLVTDYGIDTEGDVNAKVVFSVLGDDRELFKSKVMGRFDIPKSARVDVKGVRVMTLRISRGQPSIFGAHADWLEPMLMR